MNIPEYLKNFQDELSPSELCLTHFQAQIDGHHLRLEILSQSLWTLSQDKEAVKLRLRGLQEKSYCFPLVNVFFGSKDQVYCYKDPDHLNELMYFPLDQAMTPRTFTFTLHQIPDQAVIDYTNPDDANATVNKWLYDALKIENPFKVPF